MITGTGITLGGLIGTTLVGVALGLGWTVGTHLGKHVIDTSNKVVAKVGTMRSDAAVHAVA